ncbi:MAG TPA: hypothetical protein VGW12_07810 [Pyrinomonadaceae bacterium]|nr:hypothetical protein [Pyrinomonadaceae bacterium]
MKTGFHFDADHESLGRFYGGTIEEEAFKALAQLSELGLSTKMYVGDLRLNSLAMEWKETEAGKESTLAEHKYLDVFVDWLAPASVGWARFPLESIGRCFHRNIYVIYLDGISTQTADRLNRRLETLPYYLGALEVDERFPTHRVLYRGSLIPLCRIDEATVSIFYEGFEGEDFDQSLVKRCKRAGFNNIRYEMFSEGRGFT